MTLGKRDNPPSMLKSLKRSTNKDRCTIDILRGLSLCRLCRRISVVLEKRENRSYPHIHIYIFLCPEPNQVKKERKREKKHLDEIQQPHKKTTDRMRKRVVVFFYIYWGGGTRSITITKPP